ncbi:hypothetical protein Pan216_27230 [Planctomycetes bacterium Pan216]|uniref:Uncharacterized protein n=1 Tax=Kolteria novifilia TaxID=2527975 RepID=A0A518B4F7_9BACT|nr:hypothetical protein Pan216_27230 [Planctomycetes bacterium Pan216]
MELSLFAVSLAAGLAWTLPLLPTTDVHPGFFRTSWLVCLGLLVLSFLSGWNDSSMVRSTLIVVGAVGCYLCFFLWALERIGAARNLGLAMGVLLIGVLVEQTLAGAHSWAALEVANALTGAWLMGACLGAMLLGHDYLTAPWMSLTPLRRLILSIFFAASLRSLSSLTGLLLSNQFGPASDVAPLASGSWWFYVSLRLIVGLLAPLVLSVMAWQVLKYKHTQAATGILYVAVIVTMIGEVSAIALNRLAGVPV